MSNKIQLRRGGTVDREAITPDSGEPCWDTDEKQLYVGDGETAGGAPVVGDNVARLNQLNGWTQPQYFPMGLFQGLGQYAVLDTSSPLHANNLASGTVPLARMHANVARRDQANTFAAAQTFNLGAAIRGLTLGLVTLDASAGNVVHPVVATDTVFCLYATSASFNNKLNLPPLTSVPDGRTILLFNGWIAAKATVIDAGTGNNITQDSMAVSQTASLVNDHHAVYIIIAVQADNVWQLFRIA